MSNDKRDVVISRHALASGCFFAANMPKATGTGFFFRGKHAIEYN